MSDDCKGVKEDVQLLQDAVLQATKKQYRDGSEKKLEAVRAEESRQI